MSSQLTVLSLDRTRLPDRRRFLRLARTIYRNDPNWVAPLDSELHSVLGPRNPFFAHAEAQLWVAVHQGQDVGRIAAILDRSYTQLHGERVAFFGFFECVNCLTTAGALFQAASQWSCARGSERLRGPMNPSINDECGLLVEGFARPPVLMMTYNPPYYRELIEKSGFVGVKDLLAFEISVAAAPGRRLQRLRSSVDRRNPDLQLKSVTKKTLSAAVPSIKRVYNEAWENNWGSVPLTGAEIDFLVERLRPLLVDGLVWLAELRGEAVGFLLAFPDFNEVLRHLGGRLLSPGLWRALPYLLGWRKPTAMRLVALGVLPEYRGRGIEAAMLAETLTACQREGYTKCEASWVLEDNQAVQRVIEIFGGRRYKTYRLYERTTA